MKITTVPSLFGQSMKIWGGEEIKFDHTGLCEVDEDLGKKLLEVYPTFMFTLDKKEEVAPTVQQEINQELVLRLEGEILSLKDQVKEAQAAKKGVDADLKDWKSKIAELTKRASIAESALGKIKDANDNVVQSLELRITLMGMNVAGLKKLCEDSGYVNAEWESLTKEKLIEYMMSK